VGLKVENVKKFDIQKILEKISVAREFQRLRAVIRSRTVTGNFWRGKFEANETVVTLENCGRDDERC
jgi:hypothetical protein